MPAEFPATVIFSLLGAENTTLICRFGVLRLKRFAAIAGKLMRMVIQAVGLGLDSFFVHPLTAREPRAARLIVKGKTGLDRAGIKAALQA